MGVDERTPGPTGQRTDEWTASPWWRRVGWVLVAGWVLVIALVPLTGEKESTYGTLVGDLVDGVSVLEVEGLLPESSNGWGTVRIRWRSGGIDRVTEVVDASSPREARRARREMRAWESQTHVQVNLAQALREWSPDVHVQTQPFAESSGLHGQMSGWRTPGWLALAALTLGLTTLGLVVSGPRPRRANRWAWFWMLLLSPLGLALYLAFGGPAGRREPSPPRAPYMRGGWGFLAALVLATLWSWAQR